MGQTDVPPWSWELPSKSFCVFTCMKEKNNCFYPLTMRELLAYSRSLSELMLYTTLLFPHVYGCSLVCRPSCMCIHVEAKSWHCVSSSISLHFTYIEARSHTWFCQFTYSSSPDGSGDPPPAGWEYRQVPKLVWHFHGCSGACLLASCMHSKDLLPLGHHPAPHSFLKGGMR